MALVDDDAEGILTIVFAEEAGKFRAFLVEAESLVGGDVGAGILGRIPGPVARESNTRGYSPLASLWRIFSKAVRMAASW